MALLLLGLVPIRVLGSPLPYPSRHRPPSHELRVDERFFPMPDRVRLAATVFCPLPRVAGERFPVLLELLPYRKDDSFARRDFRHHAYFARRGYVCVRVDVRGTGTSEASGGAVPDREYSNVELDDAVSLIQTLSREPGTNGRVGMWGISWGGFNAIQTAMRQPPALGAILAVDATDDLYHDDVHYLDGIFHVDAYQLEIDHENGLPVPPDYRVDAPFLADRFLRRPWILRYLEEQRDGAFWATGSLRGQYHRLRTPAFLIGGLQDLYRDSVPRMLEHVRAPVVAWIGPWNHDFPDSGTPGPDHDWREAALAWWDHWLRGIDRGVDRWSRLAVYVRHGHPPGGAVTTAPGHWRTLDWPDRRIQDRAWHTAATGRLVDSGAPGSDVALV
ncbi:MAG: CocE/NonD family hydrolase, partial [Candidatus Riflebacteria bacterium]|nr:CocE/NonD family hydrolase [Candidatus Riflebacteria bacterium]